jgi:hypothetical protein
MELLVTPVGAVLAALAVAGGAPLFSDGLRTLRLRRYLRGLEQRPLSELPTGVVWVRGRVALDGPLFSPLSGQPCAGFRLEVRRGENGPVAAIEESRAFRVVADEVQARVLAENASLTLAPTGERALAAREPLNQRLADLLARSPEVQWWRRIGAPLRLTEHALLAGGECQVIGYAREGRPFELSAELELQRTGTGDDGFGASTMLGGENGSGRGTTAGIRAVGALALSAVPEQEAGTSPNPYDPDLWIDRGGQLDLLHVGNLDLRPRTMEVPVYHLLGLGLGPLLTLAGLLYLAGTAERLRSLGGF